MSRKKIRPENTPYVFSYEIKITGDLPQIVWDTARNQQALWNWLATQHQLLVAELSTQEAGREAKKTAYDSFWKRAYDHVRDEGEALGLPTWAKWQIYDAFKTSQQAWARKAGGMPDVKHGLRRIKIEHRTDSGGVPVSWLYRDSDRKHTHLRSANGLTRGYFSINKERIHFETVLHQRSADPGLPSIDQNCILKRIALCGHHEPAFREWQWKIIFLVERPPQEIVHGNVVAGLDLGWRTREDGLRIGVIYTPSGSYEIFLPFNLANHSERKQIERYPDTEVTRDIRQVWEMQTTQDELLEACKAKLKEADRSGWPEAANEPMAGIIKMRAGGLRRIRKALKEADIDCELLDDWLTRHIELSKRIRKGQIRIGNTKAVMYRNLAAWLSRHCAVLAWEDDLSLKDLAEEENNQEAIKRAQKHRQYAGLFRLRQFIREKMNERIPPEISGAYSTQECYLCGGHIEPGPKLYLICENGHRIDQDWNSGRILYHRLPKELRAVVGVELSVDRSQISRNIRPLSP